MNHPNCDVNIQFCCVRLQIRERDESRLSMTLHNVMPELLVHLPSGLETAEVELLSLVWE